MTTPTEPIIPPIPNVPIADPTTGRCAREWWLWFNQVFQVALAQQGQIDVGTIFPFVPADVPTSLADPFAGVPAAALLADPPADPLPAIVAMAVPADVVSADQIIMQTLSLGIPA